MSGITPPARASHGGIGLRGDHGGGRNRWTAWGVGGMALLVFVLAAIIVYQSAFCCVSGSSDAAGAGLAYAQEQMVWLQRPTVRSADTLPLRRLEGALRQNVSSQVRDDVNVSDLLHHYGPNREVTLVVVTGEYNSLPPDEGVDIHGDVVVLVDTQTDRVLLLTD